MKFEKNSSEAVPIIVHFIFGIKPPEYLELGTLS